MKQSGKVLSRFIDWLCCKTIDQLPPKYGIVRSKRKWKITRVWYVEAVNEQAALEKSAWGACDKVHIVLDQPTVQGLTNKGWEDITQL